MKIIHCLFTMKMGGAQVLAVGLLNEMCKSNRVSLVIVNKEWDKELLMLLDERVNIFYINRHAGSRNILPVIKLNVLLNRLKPDIIHCHEPNMANLIKVWNGCKLVQTVHDVGISPRFYDLYHSSIAISSAVYNYVSTHGHSGIKKINNGVPMGVFQRRTRYNPPEERAYRLVQVSRLMHEKKGQDILIKAIKRIVHECGFINIQVDFIGTGPSLDYLQKLIIKNKLGGYINLLGERNRNWLTANLCTYHLLIQPSRYEGFGLTVIEGFAAGLPVLVSNIDGPLEIVSNTSAGFTFLTENDEDCAKMITKILTAYNENKMASLVSETIPVIESKYSIESCAKTYMAEYRTLLTSKEETMSRPVL